MQNRRSATTDGNLHEDRQPGRRKAPMIDVSFREFTLANTIRADVTAMDRRPCAGLVSDLLRIRIKKKRRRKRENRQRQGRNADTIIMQD